MLWLRRSFRPLGVLLAMLMMATFVIPCWPVRAADGEITVNVRIEGYQDFNHPDGTILPTCRVSLPMGSTALDALKRAAEEHGLSLIESNGFVTSIEEQKSGHFGGWNGWMYRVNGHSPNVGAASYVLQEGDTVLWYYGDWAGTQYPDVYQVTEKNGYLAIKLSSESSPITGASVTVYGSVDASVYNKVYESEDGTYTVVFADDQGNLLPPGEYTLKAEKFREDGFPEMVKPEPATINVVEQDPTPPNKPSITSAVPRGTQGIEVSGSADPGTQVVVTAFDSNNNTAATSKPVFADASGRFKVYLDIAEEGTYTLTATAMKLEVKVEANGAISESSLPSADSQPFPLDVVEKPVIKSVNYNYDTNLIEVTIERNSGDGAEIKITLSSFGKDDVTKTVTTDAETTIYKASFENIYDAGTWYTVTAKAVTKDGKESVEDIYTGCLSINQALLLLHKAANLLKNDYLENGAGRNEYTNISPYTAYVLKQAGIDVSDWVYNNTSLEDAILKIVTEDLSNSSKTSAKQLAYDLLAMKEFGRDDLVNQLLEILKSRHSEEGFDSGNYSIFSNLPTYDALGRAGFISVINPDDAKAYILGTQNSNSGDANYGSWGFIVDKKYYPDFMATAQAVRALSYLPGAPEDPKIRTAIEAGLGWMKKQQQRDGSFRTGMDDPLIDTVEAIVTLKALGIDPASWKHSENGQSPVDYLFSKAFNPPDEQHPEGSFGSFSNTMDTTWALYAYNLLETDEGLPKALIPVVIEPSSATVTVNETNQFRAKLCFYNGSSKDVTNEAIWSVEDSSVASVDNEENKGLVRGLKPGNTTIKATYNNITATAVLTVKAPSSGSYSTCTVGVAVVGKNGELLFGPGDVLLSKEGKWGMTALGALDATGLPYTMSTTYPDFVDSICGLANQGMSGWCYVVNDTMPSVAAARYTV
ncbi:MAG: DUF4430 domain-containing protein, partial [Thermacetogeniaceae bacterium]